VIASEDGDAPGVVCLGSKVDDSIANQSVDGDGMPTCKKLFP
jgi:hypothetical protein